MCTLTVFYIAHISATLNWPAITKCIFYIGQVVITLCTGQVMAIHYIVEAVG